MDPDTSKDLPIDLLAVIVSWNRPHFLRRTLESLFPQLEGLSAQLVVVDNASDPEARQVIAAETRIARRCFLEANLGINGALEAVMPTDLASHARHVLVSDADMLYRRPLREILPVLDELHGLGAVSLQHSPEHPVVRHFERNGEQWFLKEVERGCALLMRADRFQELRPLPVDRLLDFDWWVVRDAPRSLHSRGELVAVLPGAAIHLGWRAGDSTWQATETPEFDEFRM